MRSDKVLKELLIEKGNLNRGFANADVIVEGVYRTGHQEHVYIETNGVIAVPEKNGITVYGSIQCPFYVDRALRVLLGPERHVRVVQTETGGGFGGKEEYPSMLACHATLSCSHPHITTRAGLDSPAPAQCRAYTAGHRPAHRTPHPWPAAFPKGRGRPA